MNERRLKAHGSGLDGWKASGTSPKKLTGLKPLPSLELATARFIESENHPGSERIPTMNAEELHELRSQYPELTISSIVHCAALFGRRLGRSTVQNWISGQGRIPRYIDEKQGIEVRGIIGAIVWDIDLRKIGALKAR